MVNTASIKRFRINILYLFMPVLLTSALDAQDYDISKSSAAAADTVQGKYFSKKLYATRLLPMYEKTKALLPSPIMDEKPGYIEMYWKAWELGFRNFQEPQQGSGFISQFIDAAFNQNIFLWDSCFMTMFCNMASPLVPGICTLDNFYAKQYPDGEICREINRTTGKNYEPWNNRKGSQLYSEWGYNEAGKVPIVYIGRNEPQSPPVLTLDALDHPLFAWAEMESFRVTGDTARLNLVYEPLARYYGALREYLRQGNGLYMTDWASMDNSPRNRFLKGGGCGVDISCEMVLFAEQIAKIARIIGKSGDAAKFEKDAKDLSATINHLMWDPERKFYYDLTVDGKRTKIKTVAAFWTLLAGVASKERAKALAAELENSTTFGRMHRVPTLAADEPGYDPKGGYWRGAVWAPTTFMVIRGLEKYGLRDLARKIAMENIDMMWRVFKETGTVWENYAPDSISPGIPARSDFVGWSGICPILCLLEYGIGLNPDAPKNELRWDIRAGKQIGCKRFRFNNHVVDLFASPAGVKNWNILIHSDSDFNLKAKAGGKEYPFAVKKGDNHFSIDR